MGGSSKPKPHHYHMGIHFVLTTGAIDHCSMIQVGEKMLWQSNYGLTLTGDPEIDAANQEQLERAGVAELTPDEPTEGMTMDEYLEWIVEQQEKEEEEKPVVYSMNAAPDSWSELFYAEGINDTTIYVDKEELFGGDEGEGGISGNISFWSGHASQQTPPYLAAKINSDLIPAYRGVQSVVLEHCFIGTSPYPKAWAFFCTRIDKQTDGLDQWYPEKARIGVFDINPAHIIRECLVNSTWGLGMSPTSIDNDYLVAAADRLFDEGYGLSYLVNFESPMEDFIKDILFHISGVLRQGRTSGLIELLLLRDDYDLATIPKYDVDSIRKIENFSKPLATELVNTVVVKYWDRNLLEESTYRVYDPAAIALQGGTVEDTIDLTGVTNRTIAAKIASRLLIEGSTPLISMDVKIDRTAQLHNIGDPVRIDWPALGISDVAFRIESIKEPAFGKGTIILTLIQDIFSYQDAVYVIPSDSAWRDPDILPLPLNYWNAIEAPYGVATMFLDADYVDSPEREGEGIIAVFGGSVQNRAVSFLVKADSPLEDEFTSVNATLSSVAVLDQPISLTDTAAYMTLDAKTASSLNVDDHLGIAVIGDEIVEITSWDSGTGIASLRRGGYDTWPETHSAGTAVMLVNDGSGAAIDRVWQETDTVTTKFITNHSEGQSNPNFTPTDVVTIEGRIFKPYPPRAVKLLGVFFPDVITNADPVTPVLDVDWQPSDKEVNNHNLIDWFDPAGSAPAGMTYNLELYDDDAGDLVDSALGLTVLNHTFTPDKPFLRLEMTSELAGEKSRIFKHAFLYPAPPAPEQQFAFGDMEMVIEPATTDIRTLVSTDPAHFDSQFSRSALVLESATPQGVVGRVPMAVNYKWRSGTIWMMFHGQAGAKTMQPSTLVLASDASLSMVGFGMDAGKPEIAIYDDQGVNPTKVTSTVAATTQTYFTYAVDTFKQEVKFYADGALLDTVDFSGVNAPLMKTAISELVVSDAAIGSAEHRISQLLCVTDQDINGWRVATLDPVGDGTDNQWVGGYADITEAVYDGTTLAGVAEVDQDQTVQFADITDAAFTVESVTLSVAATADPLSMLKSLNLVMERGGTTTELGSPINVNGRSLYQPVSYVMATDPTTSVAWTYADLAATDFGVRSK